MRVAPDGALTMVPRSVYAPIVYAATSVVIGPVGCAGLHGNGAHLPDLPMVRVVGLEEWERFWEQTA